MTAKERFAKKQIPGFPMVSKLPVVQWLPKRPRRGEQQPMRLQVDDT